MWELFAQNTFVLIIAPPAGHFWYVSYRGQSIPNPMNFIYISCMVWVPNIKLKLQAAMNGPHSPRASGLFIQ